ncbi:hypothetical protein MLD38_040172 [Melastoma candidum]|uniref:Uncharacterized protein n=1 Tax=Melastoma candidum TaxID=119954 RepID=A0ACB9L570_9MYRT|nr:hypothetical protein MLD38_040172 [Melastoma candidum]
MGGGHCERSRSPNHQMAKSTPSTLRLLFLAAAAAALLLPPAASDVPPPLPVLPIPTARQLRWQLDSPLSLFLHFGINTFTGSEWGSGHAPPSAFDPGDGLDARQWVRVARSAGFSRLVITAKHHDGFCLWPSQYTDYSVASSPWRAGKGDVVGELARAAREEGVELGIYLSPWDRHEATYGKTRAYNEFYMGQMRELLTRYGEITYVFLDGAPGKDKTDMNYLFDSWFGLIRQLQPRAAIFSDAGPDTRWVGDEAGVAGSTSWSMINGSDVTIGGTNYQYLKSGDAAGRDWVAPECDVSIRPGWFWHASESPKSGRQLLDIYFKSLGRNCHLLLNVPPNSSGLFSEEDIRSLQEFHELRTSIFSNNLAQTALISASSTRGGTQCDQFSPGKVLEEDINSYWAPEEDKTEWALYLQFPGTVSFNLLKVQEPIHMGQRIIKFHLDAVNKDGEWIEVTSGTTVGYQRLLHFPMVEAELLRFVVDESRAEPLVSYLGLYSADELSITSDMFDLGSRAPWKGSIVWKWVAKLAGLIVVD